MKGKLYIPWFILLCFWSDRSGVSVHRAGLRGGNGVIKLPCPLCLLEDICRQERGLSVAAAGCIADTLQGSLGYYSPLSCPSCALLRGKYNLADSTAQAV